MAAAAAVDLLRQVKEVTSSRFFGAKKSSSVWLAQHLLNEEWWFGEERRKEIANMILRNDAPSSSKGIFFSPKEGLQQLFSLAISTEICSIWC